MNEYRYREGYTAGFGDGLTGKANEHEMPESEWKPKDKTGHTPEKSFEVFSKTESAAYTASEKLQKFKVGYNWGYLHGSEEREELKGKIPSGIFEKSMEEFADAISILYLKINKQRYLYGVWDLKPELEKKGRLSFISLFLKGPDEIKADKQKLEEIRGLLAGDKLLRAIDASITYFKGQKDISAYLKSLSMRTELDDLRQKNKAKKLDSEVYKSEMRNIASSLSELV